SVRHAPGLPILFGALKRTRVNYKKEVGDGIDSSVVLAPVQWIQRAVPEARPRVVIRNRDGETEERPDHKLTALIRRPNPFFGDVHLWAATVLSWLVDGNAYWLKVRNAMGVPVELWWVPHWSMEPAWPRDGSAFISHYEYRPGGGIAPVRVEVEDVVHFRNGVDPRNPRKGLSPLHGALREIFMDLEASNFVASLLKNMGVPGVVISPDGGVQPGPDDVEAVKQWFGKAFGGDKRGEPLVMGGATKVEQFGFNPQQMDLSVIRDVAEERVCASLGIPAAVVGFGAGLQATKVGATMSEMRKLAWTNGVLPLLVVFADEIERSLLPDFTTGSGAGEVFEFDVSDVQAMQDDLDKLWTRVNTGVVGGWAMVSEAREAVGLDVDDSHRIYLRPFSAIEVPADGAPPTPAVDDPKSGTKARSRPTAAQRGYVTALARAGQPLAAAVEKPLGRLFAALGKAAADAARAQPMIEFGQSSMPDQGGAKQAGEKQDDLLVLSILEAMGIEAHKDAFREIYEKHYLQVAREVAEAGKLVGLAADLPDPVARTVIAAGGRRAGLVDLTEQSKRALFDALAEGRAAGEGVEQLAARIADEVGAGPWASAETRSITIARTETKYAQNTSTIAVARSAGADRFIVFDGRLGPGRSDPDHIARDGSIVSAAEAAQMAADEHPNGTLSFAPHFDLQDED
ncbi:MAG: phage portal protein, partial [Pseudomonadota bacterium]|nr:phage portal protein [Pseudomonadota bacterium]